MYTTKFQDIFYLKEENKMILQRFPNGVDINSMPDKEIDSEGKTVYYYRLVYIDGDQDANLWENKKVEKKLPKKILIIIPINIPKNNTIFNNTISISNNTIENSKYINANSNYIIEIQRTKMKIIITQ